MSAQERTNVMRLLEKKKIKFNSFCYVETGETNGEAVAKILNQDPNRVYKTLVTIGKSKNYYVFVVPVCKNLDLKKAAKAVGEKSIDMIKQKDLLPLTGYVHGGCSMIGMKKFFKTTIDISAKEYDTIFFSAGKIGYQVEMNIDDISKIIRYQLADIIVSE